MSAPLNPGSLRPSPLDLGGLLGNTFAVFRGGLGLFVILGLLPGLIAAAAVIALSFLIALGATESATTGQFSGLLGVSLLLLLGVGLAMVLVQAKVSGMTALAADAIQSGGRPTFGSVAQDSRGMVGRVLGVYLLAAAVWTVAALGLVAVFGGVAYALFEGQVYASEAAAAQVLGLIGGFILLALVGAVASLVLTVKFLYFIQVVAIERRPGLTALRRSWQLTTGSFWRTLGALLVVSLLIWAVSGVASGVSQVFSQGLEDLADPYGSSDPSALWLGLLPLLILSALVQVAIQTVATPLLTVLATVLYRDQVRRNEGLAGPSPYPGGHPGTWQSGYAGQSPYPTQQPYPGQPGYPTQQPYPGPAGYPGQPGPSAVQPWPQGPAAYPGPGYPTPSPWQNPQPGPPQGPAGTGPDDPAR